MENSDGRIAPVTYLFGERPPAELPTMRSVFGDHAEDEDSPHEATSASRADAVQPDAQRLAEDPSGRAREPREPREIARIGQIDPWEADPDAELDRAVTLRAESDPVDEVHAPRSKAARVENVSMHALGRKGHSRRELERVLRSREIDEQSIADELERLEGVGLIDDAALAQHLVATLQERKGLGRSAIAAELTRRLLAPAAIEYALELVDTGDELARAREIAVKRAVQLRSYDRETAVRRLSAYLARRGYSGSTVRTAVDAALPAVGSGGGGPRFR